MQKKRISKKLRNCLPASLLSMLMLFSCAEGSASLKDDNTNKDKDTQTITRVDFDEVIKNVNIGFEENYNDSVLVSSAGITSNSAFEKSVNTGNLLLSDKFSFISVAFTILGINNNTNNIDNKNLLFFNIFPLLYIYLNSILSKNNL